MPKTIFDYENAPIPKEAIRFLDSKKPVAGYSYADIWAEEHALAFTVAKAMQMDVLYLIKRILYRQ